MNYTKSKYNIFVPYNSSKTIVFNSFSGAIGLFDNETMEKYNDNSFSNDEISILLAKGIYIPKNFDEKEKMDADRRYGIKERKEKLIRLWTTSACNARCYYCFEKGIQSISMTKEVADQAIAFITTILEPNDTLTFEWFGGEPLLNTDIIDYIIEKIKPICNSLNCVIQSNIISNGSLINEIIIEKMLNKWNIKSIQITLDGDEYLYNKTKAYVQEEKYNFDKVINNIKLLSEKNIHVSIRMNYDTSNYESLSRLIDYLYIKFRDYKNIFYYVYPLWDSLNEDDVNPFKSNAMADNNLLKLFDKIASYNMTPIRMLARLNYKKFQCVSCSEGSFTIFPDGKLGKCSETFMQKIGDVWNGVTDTATLKKWTDVKIDGKCDKCVYLPLCQGGCRSSLFTKMPQCFAYKPIIPDILRWYVETIKNTK